MTSKHYNEACSTRFSFLSLPRELRDQVYRELLIPKRVCIEPPVSYGLEPVVLRVNKQIYEEGSTVLHGENIWVLFSMECAELISIYSRTKSSKYLDNFVGSPNLKMDLRGPSFRRRCKEFRILVTVHEVRDVYTNFLISFFNPGSIECSLRFHVRPDQYGERVLGALVDSLGDVRGIGSVIMTGIKHSIGYELSELMTTPIQHIDEILKRAKEYQYRGDQQLDLGHFSEAECIYHLGYKYVNWVDTINMVEQLDGVEVQSCGELNNTKLALRIESAFCLIKIGKECTARKRLLMIPDDRDHLPESLKIKLHFYAGLAFLAENKEVLAAQEFKEVLKLQPEHEGVRATKPSMDWTLRIKQSPEMPEEDEAVRDFDFKSTYSNRR